MFRHTVAEWAGHPAHLLYGPDGVLEFRPEGHAPAHLMVHRAKCWSGCEGRPDGEACPGSGCDRMEVACHPTLHTGILSFRPEIAHLSSLAWGDVAAALRELYPRVMAWSD